MTRRGTAAKDERRSRAEARATQQTVQPIPKTDEAKPKQLSPFAKFYLTWKERQPDWTLEGFEAACEKWLEFLAGKECHDMVEMLEFLAHNVGSDLRQRKVEAKWIFTDKLDGRPYVKISMADRWVYYHDVAITIPKAP